MGTTRLEAFSDGVIAIIITIMVLELHAPESTDLSALTPLLPSLLSYVLSFVYIGIYWNNHHHLLHATEQVSGWVLWANLHLLFWLSLVPFVTSWVGRHPSVGTPTACYGVVLLMASIAWLGLERAIIAKQGARSRIALAFGREAKGLVSTALYLAAVLVAFAAPWLSQLVYLTVALLWLVPDPRIERLTRS
jgi:uncharacterized membrane protein